MASDLGSACRLRRYDVVLFPVTAVPLATNMKHALAPVAALLIGVSILLTGQGLQGTLLPVRASLEDFSTISIGVIGGAYFLGFTLGCLKSGELIQRVGHVRVFAAMTALASASPRTKQRHTTPCPLWATFPGVACFSSIESVRCCTS